MRLNFVKFDAKNAIILETCMEKRKCKLSVRLRNDRD